MIIKETVYRYNPKQRNHRHFYNYEKEREYLYKLRFADYFSDSLYGKMLGKLHSRVIKTINTTLINKNNEQQ